MMQLGIMAKTFVRPDLDAVLDAVQISGLNWVQFNMSCAGLPALPDDIPSALGDQIRQRMAARGLTMAALSGSFNMIHPNPAERRAGLTRLGILANACERLGTSIITLCTGTRDPDNMWRRHPDNDTPEAWQDLIDTMAVALQIAENYNITLAFEPEVANVIDSALKARRLLNEMQSSHLRIVMDGANLFHAGQLPYMREVLHEAFDLLGQDIALAHAKDLSRDGAAGQEAAGTGLLDYDYYIYLLREVNFAGGLILHGLTETQVPMSAAFLREKLNKG